MSKIASFVVAASLFAAPAAGALASPQDDAEESRAQSQDETPGEAESQDPPTEEPQDEPEGDAGGEAEGDAAGPEAAPETFDPLAEAFSLVRRLREDRTAMQTARVELQDLRDRIATFNETREPTERSLAIEAQLSLWLNDANHIVAMFNRPEPLAPRDPGFRVLLANQLALAGRYDAARALVDEGSIDAEAHPIVTLIRAEALHANNEFDAAAEALEALPATLPFEGETLRRYYALRSDLPDLREAWADEVRIREAEAARDDLPRVAIKTSKGVIVAELFEDQAPNTVANFISLAEDDFYAGTTFHRVIPRFMAQGGDPNTREGATGAPGTGGPGYSIADELEEGVYRRHFGGVLSMANSGPDTGGSQFFITHQPTPHLDGKHTVFGRVLEGMDVVRRIERDDEIVDVEILRKREHEYEPVTLNDEAAMPPADGGEAGGTDDQAGRE